MDMNAKLNAINSCPNYSRPQEVRQHLSDFLTRNGACEVMIVGISVGGQPKHNCIQIRGKMPIEVNNKQRPVGFKFIIPAEYPKAAPFVYLDEPEDP